MYALAITVMYQLFRPTDAMNDHDASISQGGGIGEEAWQLGHPGCATGHGAYHLHGAVFRS